MSGVLSDDVSQIFTDKDAETKLIELMEQDRAALWSVSKFVKITGFVRARVDRAAIGLESKGLIQGETIGRTRVIRYTPDGSGENGTPASPSSNSARTNRNTTRSRDP